VKVVELMNSNVVTCRPSESLIVIVNRFELFNISGMPVVEKGKLAGMICQSDILKNLRGEGINLKDLTVKDVMIEEVITVSPIESVETAAKRMIEKHINRIPVVENNIVVGIVTRTDIVKAVAEYG